MMKKLKTVVAGVAMLNDLNDCWICWMQDAESKAAIVFFGQSIARHVE